MVCPHVEKVVKSKPITEFPINQNDISQASSAWYKLQIELSYSTWRGLWQEQCKVIGEPGGVDGVGDEVQQ